MVSGERDAAGFLQRWFADKQNVVLVTGRSSYETCGAAAFLSPYLSGVCVTRLMPAGENPQKDDIDALAKRLPQTVDAFVAVGGGTVIDTAKLLRGFLGVPFLAVPTTAGTGAEATRFAVYYEAGVKHSADDIRYLPTDQLLIPGFCDSASDYQKACCAFDAYAQAVESLWANGATDESRSYARKALELMDAGEQQLGAYWAGRAIDISRTTAAHALSYYLTSHYGIPHGHAVYMVFPYVCHANGHPEFIRTIPKLTSLEEFAVSRSIDKKALVRELLLHVNVKRLENNPCPIEERHFLIKS